MFRDIGRVCAPTIAIALAGCAHFHNHPLTDQAVADRLRPPDWDSVRLRVDAFHHPLLPSVHLRPDRGLSPDEAAVLAVLLNPSLVAARDRRGIAAAQLMQAGLLPNPQLSANVDKVIGGAGPPDAYTAYGLGLGLDVQALIERAAKRAAARAHAQSVNLEIAWKEWQAAEAAKLATYQLLADREQLDVARDIDRQLAQSLAAIRQAVNGHYETVIKLATAESASQTAHATVLGLEQSVRTDELQLKKAIGLPPETPIKLRHGLALPSRLSLPLPDELTSSIETTRLDLLALKRGYASQEQTVRAAILGQFPALTVAVNGASDNSHVRTLGPSITIGLPIFDHNQAAIAAERATRRQLFDEYVYRVFTARAEIATQLENIRSLTTQIAAAKQSVGVMQRQEQTYRIAASEHNVDVFSYYSAQNDLSQARLKVLKLQMQLVGAEVALELATGRYLPEGKTR